MDDLDGARHDAIRYLSAAVAEERLPIEQLETRLPLIRQAPNRSSIEAIIADILPSGGWTAVAQVPTRLPAPVDPDPYAPVEPAEVLRIATVFGSSKRAGNWTVPLRLELRCVAGELTVDLRDAVFLHDLLEIDVQAKFGSVTLIVPAGAQVENECEERFSGTSHSVRSSRGANPLGILIRITGRVVFSSVEIKEKRSTAEAALEPAWWQKLLSGS